MRLDGTNEWSLTVTWRITSGKLLLGTIKFREMVKDADLVITGEGSADRQTLMGKLPMGILQQSGVWTYWSKQRGLSWGTPKPP